MSKYTTNTDMYYAVECRNVTDNSRWFFIEYGYDRAEKFNTVAEAKERIRARKATVKSLSVKCKMEYRVVRITETVTKEVVE